MTSRPAATARGLFLAVIVCVIGSGRSPGQLPEAVDSSPGYMILKVNLVTSEVAGQGVAGGLPVGGGRFGGDGEYGGFGGGYPGGMPALPGIPGQPGAQQNNPSQYVVAVIPYYRILRRPVMVGKAPTAPLGSNPRSIALQISADPKTGATQAPFLYVDGVQIQGYAIKQRPLPDQQLAAKQKRWQDKGRPLDGVDSLYELVGDALAAGLPDKAADYLKEMVKTVKARKDGLGVPERVAKAAQAFETIEPIVNQELPEDPDANKWKSRLGAADVSTLGTQHYAIINYGDQAVSPETLMKWAELLERNYKSFFLWNALNGRVVKPPVKRLTVVLLNKASDLPNIRESLDGTSVVTDGFYSATHHLLVLSPERTDENARAFNRYLQNSWQSGWSRDDLIKGKAPAVGPKGKPAEEAYRMMTLVLVDRMLEEEGQYAVVSREGTRQLYAATGVLPTYVSLPRWVESGATNLLAKLKGPVVNMPVPVPGAPPMDPSMAMMPQQPVSLGVALSPGYGGPNYVLIRKWRDLINRRELPTTNAGNLLKAVISDKYFDAVAAGVDHDAVLIAGSATPSELQLTLGTPIQQPGGMFPGGVPGGFPGGYPGGGMPGFRGGRGYEGGEEGGYMPGGVPGGATLAPDPAAQKRALTAKLEQKAQATSWALIYYLSKARPDKLQEFYNALGRMPRDMYLDPALVSELFYRSFDLLAADGSVDEGKVTTMANAWLLFMKSVTPPGVDIPYKDFGADPAETPPGGQPGVFPPTG